MDPFAKEKLKFNILTAVLFAVLIFLTILCNEFFVKGYLWQDHYDKMCETKRKMPNTSEFDVREEFDAKYRPEPDNRF